MENAGHLVCFGVWYLSFFLTDRLSLVDAICPFFLRFGDIGSNDGVFWRTSLWSK